MYSLEIVQHPFYQGEAYETDEIKIIFSELQKNYVHKILSWEDDVLKVRRE
jgi:hypothetical protein